MAAGDKLFLADKETLDIVNHKIGEMSDIASTVVEASHGNIFKRLYYLVFRLGSYTATPSASGVNVFSKLNYILAQNDASLLTPPVNVPHSFSSTITFSDTWGKSIIIDKFVSCFNGKHTINISMDVTSTSSFPNVAIDLLSWNNIIAQNAYASTSSSKVERGMDFYMSRPIGSTINHSSLRLPQLMDIDNTGQQTITMDIYCKAGEPYILTMDCYGENASQSVGATISAITITAG